MTTATFYPVDDCDLRHATRNTGASTYLQLSNVKQLLRFSLSSISSSAIINSATLRFTVEHVTLQSRTTAFRIYKIADANGDWIEGTKNYTTAGAGEPTMNCKEADGSGGITTYWAGGGNFGVAGTDYVNTELASYLSISDSCSVGDTYTFTFNASGLAVLQDWFGDVTNNGLVTSSGTSVNIGLASKEHATESYRPVLSVTYTTGSTGVPKHFLHYARLRSN